jgi:hypothetical protein
MAKKEVQCFFHWTGRDRTHQSGVIIVWTVQWKIYICLKKFDREEFLTGQAVP